jgi:hypothetical protein
MQKLLLTLVSATVLAMAGCADMDKQSSSADTKSVATADKPGLSQDASAALATAQAEVKAAKAKNALWTPAEAALKSAEEAADKADSAAVIKDSKKASSLAKLGLQQLDEPLVKFGN